MGVALDITGIRFGRLVAIKCIKTVNHSRMWLCQCDCGSKTEIRAAHLSSGATRSCGCLCDGNPKHGMRNTKEYRIWAGIKQRCYNQNVKSYKDYGGKGVVVCDEWLNSFDSFFSYMGNCPSENHTIDRINSCGNYEPGNCRWATRKEQNRNRGNTVFVDFEGNKISLPSLADKFGIPTKKLWTRLFVYKWSIERALSLTNKDDI